MPSSAPAGVDGFLGAALLQAGSDVLVLMRDGHGDLDMAAYDKYFAGELQDVALDEAEIERALAAIEGLPAPA